MTPVDESTAKVSSLESDPSSRLRWLFLGVSGSLLALLLVSGILAVRKLGTMHAQELAITRAMAERTQMLSSLWLSIQNYNEAVRQLVADTQADRRETPPERIDQLTLEIDADLHRYPVALDPTEAELLAELHDVFLQQRVFYVAVLEQKPDEVRREPQSPLVEQMVPIQKKILDWSVRLEKWNEDRLKNADQSRLAEFGQAQGGLTRALAVAFGSGFLLVMAALAYIVRLERQTRGRYTELAQSRLQLQDLSSRLVDAQETERRSISRELHDEVGQALGALRVDLGRLSTALSDERPEVTAQLDNMKSVTERTLQEVRNIALLLRPSMLDDLGLIPALEWQGREVSRRSEIEVEVQSEGVSKDLPDEYRICIYRIVQEALGNAVRHSGARNAKVIVRQSGKGILVRVSDDGKGFDPQRTRGLGLLGMEERVKRLAGTFAVESDSRGVTVSADLPFPPSNGRLS